MKRATLTLGLTLSLIVADSNAAAVTGWATTSTTVTLSNTSTASPTWGSGTLNSDNAKATNLYASFPTITLAAVGDAVTLTGSATLVGANVTGTGGGFFRFGMFDVSGKSDTNGWLGYMAFSTGSNSTGTLYERAAGNTGAFTSSTGATPVATVGSMGTGVVLTNTQYDFTFNIALTAPQKLTITSSLKRHSDNLDFGNLTFTDTTPQTYTFNRVGFQNTNETNADQIQMSNVAVVPEASACLLGGLGVLALLRRRR
jgi:hypothetical protein